MPARWWKLSAVLGWGAAAAFALHAPARPAGAVAPAGAPAAARPGGLPWWGAGAAEAGGAKGLEALAEARTPAAMCKALNGLGRPAGDGGEAARAVRRLLDERPRRDVRECAVAALALLGGPEARDALDELRRDGQRAVRMAALGALAQSVEPGAFELVARQANERDAERRHEALVALGRAGRGEVVPRLVEAIDQAGGAARAELVDALGAAGDAAVGPLARLLSHPSPQVQASAAQALAQAGGAEAVGALARALADGTAGPGGAERVATVLAELGEEGRRALQEAAESRSADVRAAARRALIDAGGEVAREQLEGWLASGDRRDVDLALDYLQAHAGEVAPPAPLTALARERPDAAERVAIVLGATGGEEARAALRELADGGGPASSYALRELGALPGEAAWVRGRLVQAVRDEGGQAAAVALEALAEDGSPEARDALIAAGRERGFLAWQALTALGRFPGAEASRALAEAAQGESPPARNAALTTLAGRSDAAAKAGLLGAVEAWQRPGATLPDGTAIASVCTALAEQGAPEGERLLRRFADSRDERDWAKLTDAFAAGARPLPVPLDLAERLARDVERPYAELALQQLAERDAGRARAVVEGLARSGDEAARRHAVFSAELLPEAERARLLQSALLDRDESIVTVAVRALERGGGRDDQAALAGLLSRGEAPPEALSEAARALRGIGGEAARRHHDLIERYGGPEGDPDGEADETVEGGE